MDKFSVVLVDDHQLFVEGMKSVLNSIEEVASVSVAANSKELFSILYRVRPALVLLDLNLVNESGLELISRIRSTFPEIKILVVTSYPDSKYVKKAFDSGVDGYMLKNGGKEELEEGIRQVMLGEVFFGQGVHLPNMHGANGRTLSPFEMDDRFIQKNNLTKREVEILTLVGQAYTNKQIAEQLFISEQTVSVHKKNLMRKLGVSSTAALVKIAFQTRLVQ